MLQYIASCSSRNTAAPPSDSVSTCLAASQGCSKMASRYSTSRNAAPPPPAAAASAQPEQETEEDFNTSPPGLW